MLRQYFKLPALESALWGLECQGHCHHPGAVLLPWDGLFSLCPSSTVLLTILVPQPWPQEHSPAAFWVPSMHGSHDKRELILTTLHQSPGEQESQGHHSLGA